MGTDNSVVFASTDDLIFIITPGSEVPGSYEIGYARRGGILSADYVP